MTLYRNFIWGETGEVQSMLVEHGRVVWRGDERPSFAEVVDLSGRVVLPAFIDAHCHILPMGLMMQTLDLSACSTPDEVLDRVRDRLPNLPPHEWLLASYYDQTKFPDGVHLTRHDLDRVSEDRPILLRHVNGHASIANSATLRAAGVDAATPDPPGGEFGRDPDGTPNGVLLEIAHEMVSGAAPSVDLERMVDAILTAGEAMSQLGIKCATDMMTGRYHLRQELEAYKIAADRGNPVRVRLCLQWKAVFGDQAQPYDDLEADFQDEWCRVWGVKIFADGAIGSATAAIHGHYEGTRDSGRLIYAPERLKAMVQTAHDNGYPVAIHSIGDRATDYVLDAFEATGEPQRHRIEHAMLLSDDQIQRMARLGVHCTFQPEFLMRFGHAYRRQLGPERASPLKRARSVIDAGIPLSFNSDRPIVPGDPRDGIRTASSRPEGFDPAENVTLAEAIHAYTLGGALANGDAREMGGLLEGQLADFQSFPQNPYEVGFSD